MEELVVDTPQIQVQELIVEQSVEISVSDQGGNRESAQDKTSGER